MVSRKAMSIGRGALIAFEGCDRAGKSTQVMMLIDALNKRNIPVESRSFPDRSTSIGKLINNYLTKKQQYPPETAHLLFSANRWECKDEILAALHRGTTVVIDRYAASGAAYSAVTTDKSLNWCSEVDRDLPCPDLVILLKVSTECQRLRKNWGSERFEDSTFQEHVALNYEKLMDKTWFAINANQDKSVVHLQVLEKVLHVIQSVQNLPVGKLYNSSS